MKILDAGHKYEVDGYDGAQSQEITFMKREGENFPHNKGSYGGTNCQELLRVLIDRTEYLQNQQPCAETEAAIANLKSALLLFEIRAASRHYFILMPPSIRWLVSAITCGKCGHIVCRCGWIKPVKKYIAVDTMK